jgi:hypothetical protein
VSVILLGPQRRPTLQAVVRSLALEGPVATINAGWQEREPADEELDAQVDGRGVNLGLYARWLDVQERDPLYAAADRKLREVLGEVQDNYLVRLDFALRAVYAVQGRGGNAALRAEAFDEALAAVRALDARHLERVGEIHGGFYDAWPPHDRPVVAEHRAAVARVLSEAALLVVTGGHVGVLIAVLHLFNVAAALRSPVIAWSAGAMALTDRIVLFHDRAPQGPGHPEVYGAGLGVVRAVVPLPHARGRLLLDDAARMAVFAQRFAPARCVLLEEGTRVDVGAAGELAPGARVLGADGRVTSLEAA